MVNLTDLARLSGAADANFEALTRAIVSRRYGALGTLREWRQQPGVEFFLRVEHAGELGDRGRIWGWSCKWFVLGRDNELTRGQRQQIEDSMDKAIQYVAGLTDFVLCLPQRPSRNDEEWIAGLGPAKGISARLWAQENFDAALAGLDELRSTFFGELVLSPDVLARAHERAVAPVRARWMPALHSSNHVERQLERALLRPASFDWVDERADGIAAIAEVLRCALGDIDGGDARAGAEGVFSDLVRFVADLRAIVAAARNHRPMEIRERIADLQPPVTSPRKLRALVLALRKRRLPAALAVTGLGAEVRDVLWWLDDARTDAEAPLVAVVAPAGLGKTHLAAHLTAPEGRPTAGVFLQGGRLRAGGGLDDLAHHAPGLGAESFESLLEALNSAGARAGARVPLIIDGLNEAERPLEWRYLLDQLVPALGKYPHVAVIVTLREALAARSIPDSAVTLELEWNQSEAGLIARAYFEHFKIDPAGAWLPAEIFYSPLLIRMYCEAANPTRQNPVGAEALPTSLVGVFELYRERVVERLATDPFRIAVPADQIRRRLAKLAMEMWSRGVRRLPFDHAKEILDAGERNWDESLFRRLEDEGVLFREEADGVGDSETGVVFDRFAGYLIADAILVGMANAEVEERLGEAQLWTSLFGENESTFGEDVAISLIGLLPRRFRGHHLWRLAPEAHRTWALVRELDLESDLLDDATVDELAKLIASGDWRGTGSRSYGRRHPFDRLWEVQMSPAHRLNAFFLNRVLRMLPLPQRDLVWTEWIRSRAEDVLLGYLRKRIVRWTNEANRAQADDLEATAVSWLLTSTRPDVRDLATKALQRYGRLEPQRLFELARRLLDVDDLYVVERVVGAAFGAASSHQVPDPGGPFERALAGWLVELQGLYLEGGSSPTSHELLRSYVRAMFELAGTLHPGSVPAGVNAFALTFAAMPPAQVMADDDPNAEECARTFGMDFENYVIGSAIDDRRGYDFKHAEFRRARGEVMARVWHLGWRAVEFADVDRAIAESVGRFGRQRARVERYGKKYGWIAYFELIGRLADAGRIRDRWIGGGRNVTPDIDPTFPDEPPIAPFLLPEWAPTGSLDEEKWLGAGEVDLPAAFWSPGELYGVAADWLLVEGFLQHKRGGRTVWGFFRTLLVEPADLDSAVEMIRREEYLGNEFLPDVPTVRGVFAGELPWSRRCQVPVDEDSRPMLRREGGDEGIGLEQVAVSFSSSGERSETTLEQSYEVPSFEFAAQFGLRQLPGTLDLVGLDGARATGTFRTSEPWSGHLLYIRRSLVLEFAGARRVVRVGWGEREVAVDWHAMPPWVRELREHHANLWRTVQVH